MRERLFQGHVTVRAENGDVLFTEAWYRPQNAEHVYNEPVLNAQECGGTEAEVERARWLLAAWDGESPVSWEQWIGGRWESYAVFPYVPTRGELLAEVA